MTRKLCVFPNDPLEAYYNKGEIKPRYFNPGNLFDEIHVISIFDSDIDEEKVKQVAGNGKLKIHVVGKVNLLNRNSKKKQIIKLIKEINPDVIRAYNPLLQGWLAAKAKEELEKPLVISLHGDYERDRRHYALKNKNLKSFFKLKYSDKTLEKFALSMADEVIIIYEFIREYAKKRGAKKINLIYNRIDLSRFSPEVKPAFQEDKPVIICVGRLMNEKNQQCLIQAIQDLDVILLIVGDGVDYQKLVELVKELNLESKVRFFRSISNLELPGFYTASDVFALPIKYGGFAIPSLEAAASGIPVILPKQKFDDKPDVISDFAMLVDNNPESFKNAIQKILSDKQTRNEMTEKGLQVTKKINSQVMEEKEKNLYLRLME